MPFRILYLSAQLVIGLKEVFPLFLSNRGAKVVYRPLILFLLINIWPEAIAQGIRKVRYFDGNNQNIKEIFYVDPLNPAIKSGPYEAYNSLGCLKTKGGYRQNLAEGNWLRYFENGKLKSSMNYLGGKLNGKIEVFFENGSRSQVGYYCNDKEDSLWRYYYESGRLKSEGFFKEGRQTNLWRYFHEDSTLKAVAVLEKGRGLYKEFFANGKVRMEGIIDDGLSDSIWNYYYETGGIKAFGFEKGGQRTGFWKFFHTNGSISAEGHFKNNEKQGRWKYYHENGKLSSEGDQESDSKEGIWKFYFPTGGLMGEGTFVKGNGDYQEYYDNGKLKMKGKIVNDLYEGLWTFYFEDGGLEGDCNYDKGVGIYTGYYENGAIKMRGKMQNGQKIGSWDLLGKDSKLIGHYKTFYDMAQPKIEPQRESKPDSQIVKTRNLGKPDFILSRQNSRHFVKKVNELKGFIVGFNPFALALSSLPISIEYFFQDRLGFEAMFTLYRQPFFVNHDEDVENKRVYTLGNSIDLRMKLYSPDRGIGNTYVGPELRISNYSHKLYIEEPTDTNQVGRNFLGEETKIEISLLLGQRFFQFYNKHKTFTLDLYGGIGAGFRFSNIPEEMLIYNKIKTNKLTIPIRLGFNFGYLF